jgi:hypothetical protein
LGIHPMDVDQTAEALYRALLMPPPRRRYHALAVRNLLLRESAAGWLDAQLDVLPDSELVADVDVLSAPAGVSRSAALALPGSVRRGELMAPAGPHPFTDPLSARARRAVFSADWPADAPAVLPASSESAPALPR